MRHELTAETLTRLILWGLDQAMAGRPRPLRLRAAPVPGFPPGRAASQDGGLTPRNLPLSVAKVCLENVRCYVLGDAGALGKPVDDLLYRVRTNDPALIQREVRNRSGIGPYPDRGRGRSGTVSLDCTFWRGYAKNPR
jgi:hypothetical protein